MVTISDKILKASSGTRPNPTTLTANKGVGDALLNADDLTGWATDTPVTFVLFKVDTSGNEIVDTRTDWKGIVSGNTITQLVLTAGVDTIYPSGSPVIAAATARWADDLATALLVSHNQNGTLKDGTVGNTTVTDGSMTPPKWTNPYKFSAYRAAAQSPASGRIQYDTENFDSNNNFDVTTNKGRYTAPVAGFYQLNVVSSQLTTTAPQDPLVTIKKNGSTLLASGHFVNMYGGISAGNANCSVLVQLAAGDYVEVFGGNIALDVSSSDKNVFSGFLVSQT